MATWSWLARCRHAKLEAALIEAFPDARIARADTIRFGSTRGASCTSASAREVDIGSAPRCSPRPRLSGADVGRVVTMPTALFSTDFRAQEDLFALLTQVAGRAGRHALPGEVMIQTEFPIIRVSRPARG